MSRFVRGLAAATVVALATKPLCGQVKPTDRPAAVTDTSVTPGLENAMAVITSGVWDIDGEFKGPGGAYYKMGGYFAYVGSTSRSNDRGDAAVLAMFLEPMAGGASMWLSAKLNCWLVKGVSGVRCLPVDGAKILLDVNVLFMTMPIRGERCEAEITEPDEKDTGKRFDSRSSSRGRFTLLPRDK